ncbi:MAG: sugar ABC transporter ATP-binding protein [Chloroflexi bacterium]|nr:sugar ABC transporter ATP-binding protein [Chloroflexota bacterium]
MSASDDREAVVMTSAPVAMGELLSLSGISKSYGGVTALVDGSFDVRPGEIHALLGENGAGKSTLVKILVGAHHRDSGTIRWRGDPVEIRSFADAERLGIRLVYQKLNVIDDLTVARNLILGRERSRAGIIDLAEGRRRAASSLAALGIDLDLDARAGSLRVAEKQLLEIARALSGEVHLLIMDEPTASLGDQEVGRLLALVRRLRDQGMAIVFITHKLEEVFDVCDRVTVLRDGRTVGSKMVAETDADDLIAMMVGRRFGHRIDKQPRSTDRVVLEVDSLCADSGITDVSFSAHEGEVLGIYGLLGSGRTELIRALFGADPIGSGNVVVNGRPARFRSPRDARDRGLGLVPEDRASGVFEYLSVAKNLTVSSDDILAPRGWVRQGESKRLAQRMSDTLRIRAKSVEVPIWQLSGGNQQKALIGRWLARDSPILLMDDPTSGIDVGAKEEFYRIIDDLTTRGTTVIMTSSELPELLAVSDRLIVLREGRIAGILDRSMMSQERVLQLAMTDLADGDPRRTVRTPDAADPDSRGVTVSAGNEEADEG